MQNCVYRFLNSNNEVIYIGKAKDLINRLKSHKHLPKECYQEVCSLEYTKCTTNDDSLLLERYLIAKHKPKYNTVFRYNRLSYNLDEFDNKIWFKLDIDITSSCRDEILKHQRKLEKTEIQRLRLINKSKYSDDVRIDSLIKQHDLLNNYEKYKKEKYEFFKEAEKQRESLSHKEKQLLLKELIAKRKRMAV